MCDALTDQLDKALAVPHSTVNHAADDDEYDVINVGAAVTELDTQVGLE